jgi:hypothetical protein
LRGDDQLRQRRPKAKRRRFLSVVSQEMRFPPPLLTQRCLPANVLTTPAAAIAQMAFTAT